MSGPEMRALCEQRLSAVVENILLLQPFDSKEVQDVYCLVRDLAEASRDAHNYPNNMRDPLIRLFNLMAKVTPLFIADPNKMELVYMTNCILAAHTKQFDLNQQVVPEAEQQFDLNQQVVPEAEQQFDLNQQVVPEAEHHDALAKLMDDFLDGYSMESDDHEDSEEPVAPVPAVKNRAKRALSPLAASPAKTPRLNVKKELPEIKTCDYCDFEISDDKDSKLKHALKKHRDQVFKYIEPDLVCTIASCDYVGASEKARKVHETKVHGKNSAHRKEVIAEIESASCPFCEMFIDDLVFLKVHMLHCKDRDERPILSCTGCDKTHHFIYDFILHTKGKGVEHGKPVLLNYHKK